MRDFLGRREDIRRLWSELESIALLIGSAWWAENNEEQRRKMRECVMLLESILPKLKELL